MEHPAPSSPEQREREQWIALAVYGLLVVVLTLLAVNGRGMLESPDALHRELRSDEHGPWGMGRETPFCYRPLFRWLVLEAARFLPGDDPATAFYGAFVGLSALSLLGAVGALHGLLLALGYRPGQALLGGVLFLSGFPAVFGHDIPIQVREDFLGWAWIALQLLALVRGRWWLLLGLAVVAPWIRETCLLGVLPVWWVSTRPPGEKALAYVLPGLSLLTVRAAVSALYGIPPEAPGYLWDLVVNSTAPARESPGEALLYLFAAFGAVWVAAGLRLAQGPPWRHPLLAPRVVGLALLAVAVSGWTMGMIRENRITYVLFPFLIPLALDLLESERFQRLRRSPAAWIAGGLTLLLGLGGLLWLQADPGRVDHLRPLIGAHFHLGVAPAWPLELESGELLELPLVWSLDRTTRLAEAAGAVSPGAFLYGSSLQGPHVLVHLALSAFLLAGWLATRSGPASGAPGRADGPGEGPAHG